MIITPAIKPAVGGSAIYTDILSKGLVETGIAEKVVVVSEKYTGEPNQEGGCDGRLVIRRVFPMRAALPKKTWTSYLKYAWQNLLFLKVPSLVKEYRITHVLIHSSFHYPPNLMGVAVNRLKHIGGVRVISDVRDPKLPERHFERLHPYDDVICCSESVHLHLSKDPALSGKLVTIPICLSADKPTPEAIKECESRHGLVGKRYLFFASGFSKEKGIDSAIELVEKLRETGEDVVLVVAGKKRDWSDRHARAVASGHVVYVGMLGHGDVLALTAGSVLSLNLSRNIDGMPRVSLEAMAVGSKVLLPPGVPEFTAACPENVATDMDPARLAEQARGIIRSEDGSTGYDVGLHSPERVLRRYAELLGG